MATKRHLIKNGNGQVNQFGVKCFSKKMTSTISPSPAIRQKIRRDELPNSISTPCYPSASRIRRKRSLEEHQNNERLLFLLLIELYLSDTKFRRPFTQTAGVASSVYSMHNVNIKRKCERQGQECLEFALPYRCFIEFLERSC